MTDPRIDLAKCRSCTAAIIWAETVKGKRMTVDAAPADGGNIRLEYRRGDVPPLAHVVPKVERGNYGDESWYTSHFATCPQADEWRRPR